VKLVEDGCVQLVFGRKVAENKGFVDPSLAGDIFGLSPGKTSAGEDPDSRFKDLAAPVRSCQSLASRHLHSKHLLKRL
jgi:hypothetical protein